MIYLCDKIIFSILLLVSFDIIIWWEIVLKNWKSLNYLYNAFFLNGLYQSFNSKQQLK